MDSVCGSGILPGPFFVEQGKEPLIMEKKLFYALVDHPRCGDDLEHPWKYAVPAYRAAPHVWQVGGQDDVCAYLLDCGEELMLIDTG